MVKIIPEPIVFEWDEGNSEKNFAKHSVSNKEVEEAFDEKQQFLFEDTKHSQKETRYMLWAMTKAQRKLSIIFTMRKDKVRIISARDMSKKERRAYEEKIKSNPTF